MGSSGDVVIRAEGLGKKYTIQHAQSERYTTVRDALSHKAAALGRWANPFTLAGQLRSAQRQAAAERAESEEEFWALKDVSFEIRRGERVGIIGRNGAGKSTLLKILSRITEPTTGRVEIRGRVASLLEVGTGFHPELTGRENIYLNGAILGMTRREIRSKFDEILDFAEVEKFLDTPVKRYSSGMYVRLAFAVAAHLEPEILVVDEVLAVGDASFQKKCLGKMEEVADREGRTVLFVSHNLTAIRSLCSRAILVSSGKVAGDSGVEKVLDEYRQSSNSTLRSENKRDNHINPRAMFRILHASISQDCDCDNFFVSSRPLIVEISYLVNPQQTYGIQVRLYGFGGEVVMIDTSICVPDAMQPTNCAERKSIVKIPEKLLNSGFYELELYLTNPGISIHDKTERNFLSFLVELDHGRNGYLGEVPGAVHPELTWVHL